MGLLFSGSFEALRSSKTSQNQKSEPFQERPILLLMLLKLDNSSPFNTA